MYLTCNHSILTLVHDYTRRFLLVNTLPNDTFLDWYKLIGLVDDKINVTEKNESCFWKVRKQVGKGKNAGHQHLLLFPQCFQKTSFSLSFKVGLAW